MPLNPTNPYTPPPSRGLNTLAKELTAVIRVMQSSSNIKSKQSKVDTKYFIIL